VLLIMRYAYLLGTHWSQLMVCGLQCSVLVVIIVLQLGCALKFLIPGATSKLYIN
jgi:hypothetical protein